MNADEVERLEEVDEEYLARKAAAHVLADEVRRLRREYDLLLADFEGQEEYVQDLVAERDRLREALHQTDHYIVLDDSGWAIEHLAECRSNMTACPIHVAVSTDPEGLAWWPRGRYRVVGTDPLAAHPVMEDDK